MKSLLKLLIISIFMTGCATKISLEKFKPYSLPMDKSIIDVQKVIKNQKTRIPRVFLVELSDKKVPFAKSLQLAKFMTKKIANTLEDKEVSQANLVDASYRLNYTDLKESKKSVIKIKETLRNKVIDEDEYIITGELQKLTQEVIHNKEHYTTVNKNNKKVKTHHLETFGYKVCVQGYITSFYIYNDFLYPKFKGSAEFSKCVKSKKKFKTQKEARKKDLTYMKKITGWAINDALPRIKNIFSKKGYILEAKKYKDKLIIKTTLNKRLGAKQNQTVIIYSSTKQNKNRMDRLNQKLQKLGEGSISNHIYDDYSWIVIDKLDKNADIKIGDYVQIDHEIVSFF